MRLIDADALREQLEDWLKLIQGYTSDEHEVTRDVLLSVIHGYIAYTPTLDVQPVRRGEWVLEESPYAEHEEAMDGESHPRYVCSLCHCEAGFGCDPDGFATDQRRSNFCPNCGADMRGEGMRVLIACEESQTECMAFRELGHEAYSCDIQEPSGGHPEWHILGDALEAMKGGIITTMDGVAHDVGKWDMMIAHPPCTHLAGSGARWFQAKREDGRQRDAIEFFCKLMCADIPIVVVENPVGIMSGDYVRKWFPDLAEKYGLPYKVMQIVQPFQFGDRARKTTCLFGHGWIPLMPTNIVDPGEILPGGFSVGASLNWACDASGKAMRWNDPRTAKNRSKSFPGIAKAMAEQWGGDVRK